MQRHELPLTDGWQIIDTDPGVDRVREFSQPDGDTSAWMPTGAPGDATVALMRAGRLPDVFVGDNARQAHWVTARDWWMRTTFRVPEALPHAVTELCFDSIDGEAEVYLNGEEIGRAVNAFFRYRFQPTGLRTDGQPNVLLLRFHSIDGILGGPRTDPQDGWGDRRALMRKPQFNFGWDWCPSLPSIGLGGPVRLVNRAAERIRHHVLQAHLSGRVDVFFHLSQAVQGQKLKLRLRLSGHGARQEQTLDVDFVRSHTSFQIRNPKLWWPRDWGTPHLYDYEIALLRGRTVIDRKAGRFGFREVRILEEPFDDHGTRGLSFALEINGRPILCKGSNWVPLQVFPELLADDQYAFYVRQAAAANFNMLRVWGGGQYERDIFYDLCDEQGILVWQDLMFAGRLFPLQKLRASVIAEVQQQIRRLRQHPSLVLWEGTNEDLFWVLPEENEYQPGAPEPSNLLPDGTETLCELDEIESLPLDAQERHRFVNRKRYRVDVELYDYLLRGMVGRLCPGTPYIESSPQSHDDSGNSKQSGNSHQSAWKYCLLESTPRDYRRYFDDIVSFDSEFAAQGPCSRESFAAFLPPEHLWPPDEVWLAHLCWAHRRIPIHEHILRIGRELVGPIESLDDYIRVGQLLHSHFIRLSIESCRVDKFQSGGTLNWMYNDCWPTATYALIDYYRRLKPAWYAAKRASAALAPILFGRRSRIGFYLGNDSLKPVRGSATCGELDLAGRILWQRTCRFAGCENETRELHRIKRVRRHDQGRTVLFLDVRIGAQRLPRATYLPSFWNAYAWPAAQIQARLRTQKRLAGGWHSTFELRTDACTPGVSLEAGEEAVYSDNHFDLTPGERRRVEIVTPQRLRPEALAIRPSLAGAATLGCEQENTL